METTKIWSLDAPEGNLLLKKKRSWSQAAPEEIALLKNSAPEDKRSRSHIIRSCIIRSCRSHLIRSCIIRSCIIRSCLIRSYFTRSWISTGFAKDSRIEELSMQKLSIGFENTNKGLVEFCNGHFKGVWRLVLAIWTKALTLYFVRIVQPRSPLLCFVSTLQDKKTAPEYGFACIYVPLDKEWISNLFFIGQQPNQAIYHWWKIKLQQRLFGVLAISQRLSHTSI